MSYEIRITKQAKKYLDGNKRLKSEFDDWKPNLSHSPHSSHDGAMIGEKREGLQVYKKALVGKKYRALFTIDDETVTVVVFKVKSRGEAYKK